jgi:tetratricopeptide (TPR) repeat protein
MTEVEFCPDNKMQALIEAMGDDEKQAIADLEILLANYNGDARLHFLKGSLAAARQDYAAGIEEMRHAVEIAPDYWIARYQLGFLLLTNGEPHAAQEAWGPLHGIPRDHYLRIFVTGFIHMIHDRFGEAIEDFQQGMLQNSENLPMNADIQLIVDELRARPAGDDEESLSSVDLLLRQSMMRATRH